MHLRSTLLIFGLVSSLVVGLVFATRYAVRPDAAADSDVPAAEASADQPRQDVDPPPLVEATSEPVWFEDLTRSSGVDFRHVSGNSPQKHFPAANGSGLAALDYDLDGRYDLYFATGTLLPMDPDRAKPVNRLYRNLGPGKFSEVTQPSGLGYNGFSAGLAVGDYDNDGFPDVYVTCFGDNRLYRNQGDGSFQLLAESGVEDPRWGTSAAFLDYNQDGLLDLYVCNYAKWSLRDNRFCGDEARGVRTFCSPLSVEPEVDGFYENQGDGTFVDKTQAAGLSRQAGRAQGVVAAHLDEDPYIDLYVGNDLNANSLFLNSGDNTYRDATETSGVAYDALGNSQAGMGVDAADVTGDGHSELIVTNFAGEYNTLYQNDQNGFFQDITQQSGVADESLPWVGWGTALVDFNLDGWLDVLVTNGHVDDNLHLMGEDSPYAAPPLLWSNAGRHFDFVGARAGSYFAASHPGRGLVVSDLDNDGDPDVVIGHQDAAPALLSNQVLENAAEQRRSLVVRLIGTRGNRDAVGGRITYKSGSRTQRLQIKGGASYLSAQDRRQVFAVLPDESEINLEIVWPDGSRSEVTGLQAGRIYTVIEPLDPITAPLLYREDTDRV